MINLVVALCKHPSFVDRSAVLAYSKCFVLWVDLNHHDLSVGSFSYSNFFGFRWSETISHKFFNSIPEFDDLYWSSCHFSKRVDVFTAFSYGETHLTGFCDEDYSVTFVVDDTIVCGCTCNILK